MGSETSPSELYYRARDEYPDDADAARARYVELMREHGHIVPRKSGESRALPCGFDPFAGGEVSDD